MANIESLKQYIQSNEVINNELKKILNVAKEDKDEVMLIHLATIEKSFNPMLEEINLRVEAL